MILAQMNASGNLFQGRLGLIIGFNELNRLFSSSVIFCVLQEIGHLLITLYIVPDLTEPTKKGLQKPPESYSVFPRT